MKKPCLDCGRLTAGSRCPTHEAMRNASRPGREKYRGSWATDSKKAIAEHLRVNGPVCPGFGVTAHEWHGQWHCDHHLGPLCGPCNSRKGATVDKERANR